MLFRPEKPEILAPRAAQILRERHADQILSVDTFVGQTTISVRRDRIVEILRLLRDEASLRFDCLLDLAGVDYLNQGMPERFCIVYQLFSFPHREGCRIKAYLPEEDPAIDSVSGLYRSASWAEREAFDFYGIRFHGHPDLRRIQLPETYSGYPLRKDYPLRGYGERNEFPRYVEKEDSPT